MRVVLVLTVSGAGISGPCNPTGSNYKAFWGVVAPGSWLEVVKQAGHCQFADISSSPVRWALDWLCHAGTSLSHQVCWEGHQSSVCNVVVLGAKGLARSADIVVVSAQWEDSWHLLST